MPWEAIGQFLKKLNIDLTYEPVVPRPGIDPKESKAGIQTNTHTHIHNITYNNQKVEIAQMFIS